MVPGNRYFFSNTSIEVPSTDSCGPLMKHKHDSVRVLRTLVRRAEWSSKPSSASVIVFHSVFLPSRHLLQKPTATSPAPPCVHVRVSKKHCSSSFTQPHGSGTQLWWKSTRLEPNRARAGTVSRESSSVLPVCCAWAACATSHTSVKVTSVCGASFACCCTLGSNCYWWPAF